jgi:VIT1/CCC1 family predicted Fe2+/Mn2+ transporter
MPESASIDDAGAMSDPPGSESVGKGPLAHGPSAHAPHAHDMVHMHRDVSGGTIRAAVFGVSDGLVSNVALILGVAAAEATQASVLVAGIAGLLAGASSMAAGEYVSMKAQAELVERELLLERKSLASQPEIETTELANIYRSRGIQRDEAHRMAEVVMSDPDVALEVHAREELGIDPAGTGNPAGAAAASCVAFAIGAILPLLPWLIGGGNGAIVGSALVGLVASGSVGAVIGRLTERPLVRTVTRQIAWAAGACVVTYLIGTWVGVAVN